MAHFLQVANVVLPNVDFLQLGAVGKVFERAHFVVGEGDDFEVGEFAQNLQVVDFEKAQVHILQRRKVI